ncbi:MAG: dephospho-CoA kinase [Rhodobacteraceae bacterium]|nr:dephospho-CoA kinase [Paracoccaceae bacterium]
MTRRRHNRFGPFVIGLTGSIAMGKSTAAAMIRGLGIPVFDSDAAVHALTQPKSATVGEIAKRFPGTVRDGILDRQALGRAVFSDPAALRALEAILHPRVRRKRQVWLATQTRGRRAIVAYDIPLLFETGGQHDCDAVWVVSAPDFLQRQRALRRPGMTPEKLAGALARQMPDIEKRARADLVLPTGIGKRETLRRIATAVRVIKQRQTLVAFMRQSSHA